VDLKIPAVKVERSIGSVGLQPQGHDSAFTFYHFHLKKRCKNGLFLPPLYLGVVFLEPLGVGRRYVPHSKGLFSNKLESTAQGHDRTFTFLYSLSKKAFLEGKGLRVCIFVSTIVGHKFKIFFQI